MSEKSTTNQLLDAINDGTAFVQANDVVRQEVTLPNGDTADVFVLQLDDARFRSILSRKEGYDRAEMIAATIRQEDGKPLMTVEKAGKLKPKMARILEEAAMKGNGFDKEAGEKAGNA